MAHIALRHHFARVSELALRRVHSLPFLLLAAASKSMLYSFAGWMARLKPTDQTGFEFFLEPVRIAPDIQRDDMMQQPVQNSGGDHNWQVGPVQERDYLARRC